VNAIRDEIDGDILANDIRMTRQVDARAVLVVEGDTDERFFAGIVDDLRCRIEVAQGRDKALFAFTELYRGGFAGVLFIVDADFDILDGRHPLPFGILFTDTHDLESMLLASPALDKLLRHIGQPEKIAAFEEVHGPVRAHLVRHAASLGRLLRHSLRAGLHLRFEELKFHKFVDERSLVVNEAEMVQTAINHSGKHALRRADILAALRGAAAAAEDPWHLACGHHVVEILAIGMRKALGSHDAKEMSAATIARELLLAYEAAFFPATRLHAGIRTWEGLAAPFAILPPPL
jgi:hypothetical protein